jgi:uncharacterized membrane protein
MTDNPYQTTEARPYGGVAPAGGFDIGTAIRDGLRLAKDNFGLWLGGTFVFGIVGMIAAVTVIGLFVALPVLFWGYIRFCLNIFDGKAAIGDIFSGFSRFGAVLGPMLVLFILYSLLGVLSQSVQIAGDVLGSSLLSGLGGLVNLVFTFAVLVRLYFGGYYLVDKDISAFESMEASWSATGSIKVRMIGFSALSGLVAMSGILLLGIGVLFTSGVATMAWTSAYRQMNPQS